MSYLSTHKRNILDRTSITYRDIKVGDVIEFRYKNKKDAVSKIRLAFVVNIFPVIGSAKEKKVHAFSLPELSLSVFKRLLKMIGTPLLEIDERKGKEVAKVVIKESGKKGEVFYKKISKRFIQLNAYRTYIMSEMKTIKLIQYDFRLKELGFKDEDLLQDTDA